MNASGGFPANIYMEVSDTGRAVVYYNGVWGDRVRLKGRIVDVEESGIFVGAVSY
ncbi:MAG: hypothetical protein AAFO94_14555 [Bacteroidota bacterium]